MDKIKQTQSKTRKIVFMGLICALAYICMFVFRIKVSFLTFDLKNAILVIGTFIFGPVSGILTSLIVSFIEMFTVSDTEFWGFLMNFISSASYAFIAGIIYKYKKTLSGAIIGLSASTLITTLLMVLMNILITPIYTGAPVEAVYKMILPLLLPFNLIKLIICSAVTLLIYKPVSRIFKGSGIYFNKDKGNLFNKKSLLVGIISIIIIVICVLIFIVCYNGTFELYKGIN